MIGAFEWDEEKNRQNLDKHVVSLATGIPVFDDDYRLEYLDTKEDHGEDRIVTIEHNGYTDVLYVCDTMRGHGKTRLISVRLATRQERRIYTQNARY